MIPPTLTLLLAPMEGLLDHTLRDVLTRVGGIDRCVSEFIRVTDTLLPERVFHRVVPELLNGGCTPAGVPVRPQLLGSDPSCMADNAARVATLGPHGVDLNFGCPAKVVNRHGGGAALLATPEVLHDITAAVRRAVPAGRAVTAKMRLGLDDDSLALECARALVEAGAEELVVHGRTKVQGYRPPAYWDRIADIRCAVDVPVVANGEIWDVADAERCLAESGCDSLMLGRGMVRDPGLALKVLAQAGATHGRAAGATWDDVVRLLRVYWHLLPGHVVPRHRAGRLKQWLNFLRRAYPEAQTAFDAIRLINQPDAVQHVLFPVQPDIAGGSRYTSAVCEQLLPHGRFQQGERCRAVRPQECDAERTGTRTEDLGPVLAG